MGSGWLIEDVDSGREEDEDNSLIFGIKIKVVGCRQQGGKADGGASDDCGTENVIFYLDILCDIFMKVQWQLIWSLKEQSKDY